MEVCARPRTGSTVQSVEELASIEAGREAVARRADAVDQSKSMIYLSGSEVHLVLEAKVKVRTAVVARILAAQGPHHTFRYPLETVHSAERSPLEAAAGVEK